MKFTIDRQKNYMCTGCLNIQEMCNAVEDCDTCIHHNKIHTVVDIEHTVLGTYFYYVDNGKLRKILSSKVTIIDEGSDK